MHRVELVSSAARAFRTFDRAVQQRLAKRIDALAHEPRPTGVEKLRGTRSRYRVRTGDYRIIYEVKDDLLLVLVVRIGHRREVYRNN
jgi:mRNA interferase RelE/StbE